MAKQGLKNPVVVVDPLAPDPAPTTPAVSSERPAADAELTDDQRRIRDLEHQLARERGVKDPDVDLVVPEQPGSPDNILIHFLEDGLTALGQVWYRGQELEFEPGGAAYEDTRDRNGFSWLDLRGDEFAQVERWGKVMFRAGPWPGKSLLDAASVPYAALKPLNGGPAVQAPTEEELAAAAAAEARRGRAAPRLPVR